MSSPEERIAKCEANDENIFHQLNEIKSEVKDIRKLTGAVEMMAEQMREVNTKVTKIENRMDEVDAEPRKNYQHYKRVVVDCILTGIAGALLGAILVMILK